MSKEAMFVALAATLVCVVGLGLVAPVGGLDTTTTAPTTTTPGPQDQQPDLLVWLIAITTVFVVLVVLVVVGSIRLLRHQRSLEHRLRIDESNFETYAAEISKSVAGRDVTRTTIKRGPSYVNQEFELTDSPTTSPTATSTVLMPRYSVLLNNEQAVDVFAQAAGVHLATVYEAAQNYYNDATRTSALEAADFAARRSTTIEALTVVPLSKNARSYGQTQALDKGTRPVSIFQTERQQKSKPSSVAFSSREPAGKDDCVGMTIQQEIGAEGGEIAVSGVKLTFPKGALKEKVQIRLGIIWDSRQQPPMSADQALLSPVVSCGPRGLQFRRPVVLQIPHCAGNIDSDWKITCLKAEDKWHPLSDAECTERHVGEHSIELHLNHFCRFAVTGEGLTKKSYKNVKLVAFAPPLSQTFFQIKIFCVNEYKNQIEEVRQDAHGMTQQDSQPLRVYSDGKNVCVEIESVPSGWGMSETSKHIQEVPFQYVWEAQCPNVSFVLKPPTDQPDLQICLNILGYQAGHDDDGKQSITVVQREQIKRDSKAPVLPYSIVFSPQLRQRLIVLLDPRQFHANNWIGLALKMKKTSTDIRYLEDRKSDGQSPTAALLVEWEKCGLTMTQFRSTMEELQRLDVLDEMDSLPNI